MDMGFLWRSGDKNVLNLDCGDGCTILNVLTTVKLYI